MKPQIVPRWQRRWRRVTDELALPRSGVPGRFLRGQNRRTTAGYWRPVRQDGRARRSCQGRLVWTETAVPLGTHDARGAF